MAIVDLCALDLYFGLQIAEAGEGMMFQHEYLVVQAHKNDQIVFCILFNEALLVERKVLPFFIFSFLFFFSYIKNKLLFGCFL